MSSQLLRNRNSEPIKRSIISNIKDKRKSDVLIAAKSLDHEVQNVKNLKRLSIGSMDLLIDPELEFTINNNKYDINNDTIIATTTTTAATTATATTANCLEFESDEDNSIEITRTEYLHHDNSSSSLVLNNNLTNNDSHSISVDSDKNLNSQSAKDNKIISNRRLSGVGSLKRGSNNIYRNTRKPSSQFQTQDNNLTITNNNKESSASIATANQHIKNNLLWVPASQHPHVKPQNYLELVQDTLQNISLDSDIVQTVDSPDNLENVKDDDKQVHQGTLDADINKSLRRHSSIVKRPSILRRSYNGYENDNKEDVSTSNNNNNDNNDNNDNADNNNINHNTNRDSTINFENKRSVSLKDITEELTRISYSVGLTNNDAITLARTLSMTGSYTNPDLSDDSDSLQDLRSSLSGTNNENEFASNMLMKNGITIPNRSSLRRSKFNTYKIKGATPPGMADKSSALKYNLSGELLDRRKQLPFLYSNKKSNTNYTHNNNDNDTNRSIGEQHQYSNITESPGSISDLYDHYRHSSSDWDVSDTTSQLHDGESHESHTSQDTSLNSQETSNDSVLYRPSQGQQFISERFTDNTKEQIENERPWSWIDTESSSDNLQNFIKDRESIEIEGDKLDNDNHPDFINLKVVTKKKSSEKINHSKNRHLPIFNLNLYSERKEETSNITSNDKTNTSKQKNICDSNNHSISDLIDSSESLQNDTTVNTITTNSNNNIYPNKNDNIKKSLLNNNKDEIPETRKETLEEKFVKLFKRRHHSNKTTGSSSIKGFSSRSQTQEELRKKISKFRSRNKRDHVNNSSTNKNNPTNDNNINTITIEQTNREINTNFSVDDPIHRQITVSEQPKINVTLQSLSYDGKRANREKEKGERGLKIKEGIEEEEEKEKEEDITTLPALQPAVSVTSSKQTNSSPTSLQLENNTTTLTTITDNNGTHVVETVCELDGDESQELSNSELHIQENNITTYVDNNNNLLKNDAHNNNSSNESSADSIENGAPGVLPPRKLTFADVKRPERPNAPIQFTDSAFGFPLPMLTVSTVIMFDHRLGINVERAIYRLSHLKLSDPKRELRQQVLLSNFMYAYLNLVNHTLYMEQANANSIGNMPGDKSQMNTYGEHINQQRMVGSIDEKSGIEANTNASTGAYGNSYTTEHNESNESIIIPDIS